MTDDNMPLFYPSVESFENKSVLVSTPLPVFREEQDILPQSVNDKLLYMPWGIDNQLPFKMISLVEMDETLSTCQMFNAEICYGNGLVYNDVACSDDVKNNMQDFFLDNDLPSYFLGVCQDFKHFGFSVSVIILNADASKIVSICRKEACYCRFTPANSKGIIENVLYANWRNSVDPDKVEVIPLLNPARPWSDLAERTGRTAAEDGKRRMTNERKFAVLTKIPTPDSTYYPIPYYAALFKGSWFKIKTLIGVAKEAKLKNSAPIKYLIEISDSYWKKIFERERITDHVKRQERIKKEKENILDFLTGVENSGKAWFSSYYRDVQGHEWSDVKITNIEAAKEGGDWSTDIIEAINMVCFTMRVHSNLVGSVPGKSQSNNSGSDKRELYTIAQALQKPYHDLLFNVHRIIIRFNGWTGAYPEVPFIQLTTLDEKTDAKLVTAE